LEQGSLATSHDHRVLRVDSESQRIMQTKDDARLWLHQYFLEVPQQFAMITSSSTPCLSLHGLKTFIFAQLELCCANVCMCDRIQKCAKCVLQRLLKNSSPPRNNLCGGSLGIVDNVMPHGFGTKIVRSSYRSVSVIQICAICTGCQSPIQGHSFSFVEKSW
jgi:hypothetical protein